MYNLSNKKNTLTDKEGLFAILVKPNDTLFFSSKDLVEEFVFLKPSDFSERQFVVALIQKKNVLSEVVIKNYPQINTVKMGIVGKDVRAYSIIQRKLKVKHGLTAQQLNKMIDGINSSDSFLNDTSKRKSQVVENLIIENKESLREKLNKDFENSFFTEKLKIPAEFVLGFKIYALEDFKIRQSVAGKNKALTSFLLIDLAREFISKISSDEG
ncbi:hypothetical protein [Flavobacterium sp.]|uniref:hypothetical protein n=1 Tax=Flavobacterium sp. TaxID=239 RepID=UPI002637C251|nr:hypothetical protein [Flavobacterium sp.]